MFGENLITKQKHIYLREVAEPLKMKLGKEVLDELSARELRGTLVLNGGSH